MGLDMYATKTKSALPTPVDFDQPERQEELFYWRKHPNLHGWMERLYRDKGGKAESFNLVPVQLTAEDIDKLEADVTGDHLPATTGFFFGTSSPEDKADDLKFIQQAREAINDGYNVYYNSWW